MNTENSVHPVFVLGAPRCGGTLLYGLLCSSVEVNPVLAETHYITELARHYQMTLKRRPIEQNHYFTDEEELRCFFSSQAKTFIKHVARKYQPARVVAIKSITLGERLIELQQLLPEAGCIFVVRDPRDIASSMLKVGERQIAKGLRPQYSRSMKALAASIMAPYQSLLHQMNGSMSSPGFHVLRYEDLVQSPEDVIGSLSGWSGISLSVNREDPWSRSEKDFQQLKDNQAPFASEFWGQGITASTVGAYQHILTAAEAEELCGYCKPLMQQFDYV